MVRKNGVLASVEDCEEASLEAGEGGWVDNGAVDVVSSVVEMHFVHLNTRLIPFPSIQM
jgi:hypothetical protein